MTDQITEAAAKAAEDLEMLWTAMSCAKSGEATHWPTVAGILHDAVVCRDEQIAALTKERDEVRVRYESHSSYAIILQRMIEYLKSGAPFLPESDKLYHREMCEAIRAELSAHAATIEGLRETEKLTNAYAEGLLEVGQALGIKGLSIQMPRFLHDEIVELRLRVEELERERAQ